jgi:ATP-dependent DNA helicase RecQ
VVRDTRHLYKSKEIVFTLIGRVNAKLKHIELILNLFGCGVAFDEKYWMALLRQVLEWYLYKDIETYGIENH